MRIRLTRPPLSSRRQSFGAGRDRTGAEPGAALADTSAANRNLHVETVVKGLEHPWGLTFLPDGLMLITQRLGRLRSVDSAGRVSKSLERIPKVLARGQGGLFDVAMDPRFTENRLVYISYSEPDGNGAAGTSVPADALPKQAWKRCR